MILVVVCAIIVGTLLPDANACVPGDNECSPNTQFNTKCWTRWMDCDNPTGQGDYETIANLQKHYPTDMCPNPQAIEVATVDGVSLSQAGNVFDANDVTTGLICNNTAQPHCFCRDYRVRFVCNPPLCGKGKVCYTQWFNRDCPSGTGDWEHLRALQRENPGKICAHPITIEAMTTTGIPAVNTGQVFKWYNPTNGFVCLNSEQKNRTCLNYTVRFGC